VPAPYQLVRPKVRRQPASNLVAAIHSCRLIILENGCWQIPVFQENNTSLGVDMTKLVFLTMTLRNAKTAAVAFPTSKSRAWF
jgi:hypothetical protein